MYAKAFALTVAAAVLAVAAAQVPTVCSNAQAYQLSAFPYIDSVRFQTLDAVTVSVNEDIQEPTLVVYLPDSNVAEPFRTLNVKVEDNELLVGAANNDRSQCVHLELPYGSTTVETIVADDGTNVLMEGAFNMATLKLVITKGNIYSSNNTNTAFNVQSLTLNNTGVGSIFFMDSSDSVTDLEVVNAGNGETYYMGAANDVDVHHDGMGNIFLGAVANEMLLQLTGQGEIATQGSSTLAISGLIKHPYRVFYRDGGNSICADLEVDMGNENFQPCVQSDDPIAEVEALSTYMFAG